MKDYLDVMLISIGTGVHWTNEMLESKGLKPLYCLPKGLILGAQQFIIFNDQDSNMVTIETIQNLSSPILFKERLENSDEVLSVRAVIKT